MRDGVMVMRDGVHGDVMRDGVDERVLTAPALSI